MGLIYPRFIFACPPCSGEQLFVNAMLSCGAYHEQPSRLSVHWPQGRDDLPRVMMVRHPVRWMQHLYEVHRRELLPHFPQHELWRELPRDSFVRFVERYLKMMPGAVWDLYQAYQADIVLRIEDAPWCLREFAESFGYERKPLALREQAAVVESWTPWLLQAFEQAERKALDHFIYQ